MLRLVLPAVVLPVLNIERSISILIRYVHWIILGVGREYIKKNIIASFIAFTIISIRVIYYIIRNIA